MKAHRWWRVSQRIRDILKPLALPCVKCLINPNLSVIAIKGPSLTKLITAAELLGIIKVWSITVAHKEKVRGVRWLGSGSKLITFSTEKQANGWRNTLVMTDLRTRSQIPFRQASLDTGELVAIRCSFSGSYLLLLFQDQPSEIWQVSFSYIVYFEATV